jgi:cytochrome b6-f complex iron-sulfur subunit
MSKEDNLQKNWKQDFPIKKEQSLQISRRDFAKFLVFISGGLALGSGVIAAEGATVSRSKIGQGTLRLQKE